jgi:hypothetical protein
MSVLDHLRARDRRGGRGVVRLAILCLGAGIAWMKLIPEGPRPTTTLEVGWGWWAVLALLVVGFVAGYRLGWIVLATMEALFCGLLLFAGVPDVRAIGGLVLGVLSLGLLLTPAARAHVGAVRRT